MNSEEELRNKFGLDSLESLIKQMTCKKTEGLLGIVKKKEGQLYLFTSHLIFYVEGKNAQPLLIPLNKIQEK